jgi:hypothetical protein
MHRYIFSRCISLIFCCHAALFLLTQAWANSIDAQINCTNLHGRLQSDDKLYSLAGCQIFSIHCNYSIRACHAADLLTRRLAAMDDGDGVASFENSDS